MVYVGFSTPRLWNPLSALIRRMTHSRTSHAWLLVEDPLFQLRLVLEAHSTGFRLVSLARFVKANRVVAIVTPDPAHPLDPGLPSAGEWLGAKFDVIGLFGIFLMLLVRWFRQRPWRNPFPSAGALFCSEAVVRALKEAHYPGSARLDDEGTTPQDLLDWLKDQGCSVVEGGELKLWTHMRPYRAAMRACATGAEPECALPEPGPAVPPAAA